MNKTNNEVKEAISKFRQDEVMLEHINNWAKRVCSVLNLIVLALTIGVMILAVVSDNIELINSAGTGADIGMLCIIAAVVLTIAVNSDSMHNWLVATVAEKELVCNSYKGIDNIEFMKTVRRYGDYVVMSDFDIVNNTGILIDQCDGELGDRVNETYVRINARRKNIKYYKYVISAKQARDLEYEKSKNNNMLLVLTDSDFHNAVRAVS